MKRFVKSMPGGGMSGLLAAAMLVGSTPGRAQLMLPGALNGAAPASAPHGPSAPSEPKAPVKPVPIKPPGEDAVLGHPLRFDGVKGAMQFDRAGKDVTLTKLTLPGERLSKPGEACEVNIAATPPVVATALGHPAGALRWELAIAACPFTADVLDGAVLVTSAQPSCDFVAADCRVSPVGLWGPGGDSISPQRIKDLERERVRAETVMRANFKVLLHRAGKDRAAVKAIAGEQAAFSSQREMTCRDYARESVHGFCSAQITQARSLAISSKFSDAADEPPHKPEPRAAKHAATKKLPTAAKAPGLAEPEAAAPQP